MFCAEYSAVRRMMAEEEKTQEKKCWKAQRASVRWKEG